MSSRTFKGTDGQDGEEMQTTHPNFQGEATAFIAANQNENEDAESGSGEETSIRTAWLPWRRKVVMSASTAVLCVASAGFLFYYQYVGASDGKHPIFDAPQFEQMLYEQSYPLLGATVHPTKLTDHIRFAIGHLKAKAEKDLPQDQALALKNAKLTAQQWNDLKEMVQGSDKTEVKAAGLLALQVIKQNLFSSEEAIAQKLKEALKPHAYQLIQMRSKMISPRMDLALGEWAKNHNETHGAWKGLLNSGLALQHIRDGDAPERRLLMLNPGVGGDAVGILSVILVSIGEILVHVDMFVPGFNLPSWAWRLILTPVKVVTALACTNGANVYCNAIMGAMGLNVLDAAFVLFCQVSLFGKQAANYCAKKIASSEMQTEVVDSLSEALGGPDVFHSNKLDHKVLR